MVYTCKFTKIFWTLMWQHVSVLDCVVCNYTSAKCQVDFCLFIWFAIARFLFCIREVLCHCICNLFIQSWVTWRQTVHHRVLLVILWFFLGSEDEFWTIWIHAELGNTYFEVVVTGCFCCLSFLPSQPSKWESCFNVILHPLTDMDDIMTSHFLACEDPSFKLRYPRCFFARSKYRAPAGTNQRVAWIGKDHKEKNNSINFT